MSQVVKVELSHEVYTALKQQADCAGFSLSEWITSVLALQSGFPSHQKIEVKKEPASQEFSNSSHSVTVDVGYLTGDNRGVDADLVGL